MTSYELWSLVISALSAIGTVGAVAIALWVTLHQRKRFKVNGIRVSGVVDIERSGLEATYFSEAKALFLIENQQQFPMEMISITISIVRSRKPTTGGITGIGIGKELRGQFIPAQSQYEVSIDIRDKNVDFPKDEVEQISCEIKTSAGVQVVPFPELWKPLLLDTLSFSENTSE